MSILQNYRCYYELKVLTESEYYTRTKTTNERNKTKSKKDPINVYIADKLIKPTYGKAVETVFNEQFEPFIEIQNVTNDLFKQSFAVFNQLLLEKAKQHRKDGNKIITEDDVMGWINELRDDFPVIAGPLSEGLDDGVHVYSSDTRAPNEIMGTAASPQGQFQVAKGTVQPKVNPIIKSITSAMNSGAVLPIHAFDGAEMAMLTRSFTNYLKEEMGIDTAGMVPLHDAIMVALPLSDIAVWMYNKETVDLHKAYNVFKKIVEMMERTMLYLRERLDIKKMEPVTGLSFAKNRVKLKDRLKAAESALAYADKQGHDRQDMKG